MYGKPVHSITWETRESLARHPLLLNTTHPLTDCSNYSNERDEMPVGRRRTPKDNSHLSKSQKTPKTSMASVHQHWYFAMPVSVSMCVFVKENIWENEVQCNLFQS